ncbi:SRPBCC family protein [Marinobacter confluentis]|uniref:SRPBCC family protein n=1 Tax=Marinobacter confluentis TaxID=1697557 RepID=A0A4Z1BKF7_9GAMM|nr:SRPBCC family protein [Marinobacter confluentis]TGN40197.1 SRPBCC family protein [Marinobacter confluentis]
MFHIHVERTIAKDIDTVFEALSDHAAYDRFPGVDKSLLIEQGTDEKNGKGALRVIGAGALELHERITQFERPVRMHYHIEKSRPFPLDHRRGEITLQRVGDSTRVIWISSGHIKVPLAGHILDRLAGKQFSRAFASVLRTIEKR